MIYDITDTRSYERIKNWIRELQEVLKGSASLIIVGNKVDLEDSRNIDKETAEKYAESVGAYYHECSAKDNIGINQLFDKVAKIVVDKAKESAELSRSSSLRRSNSRRTINVVDDEDVEQPRRRKCC